MFTLRVITEDHVEVNTCLGQTYKFINSLDAEKEFKREAKSFWNDVTPENTYAFVIAEGGQPYPLFKDQLNYIMTEGGQTFANLSRK